MHFRLTDGPAPVGPWNAICLARHSGLYGSTKDTTIDRGGGVEALTLARLASGADMQVELVSPNDITLTRTRDAGISVRELRGLSSPVDLRIDRGHCDSPDVPRS